MPGQKNGASTACSTVCFRLRGFWGPRGGVGNPLFQPLGPRYRRQGREDKDLSRLIRPLKGTTSRPSVVSMTGSTGAQDFENRGRFPSSCWAASQKPEGRSLPLSPGQSPAFLQAQHNPPWGSWRSWLQGREERAAGDGPLKAPGDSQTAARGSAAQLGPGPPCSPLPGVAEPPTAMSHLLTGPRGCGASCA